MKRWFIFAILFLCLVGLTGNAFAITPVYVRTDGTDAATGANDSTDPTTGAKLTIASAITALDAGGVINVKAGTYTAGVTFSKALTIQPTDAEATVILGGVLVFSTSITGIVVNNLSLQLTSGAGLLIKLNNGCGVTFNDVIIGPSTNTNNNSIEAYGGTVVYNRCRFKSHVKTSTGNCQQITALTNASTVIFNYCYFEQFTGTVSINVTGCAWTWNNCVITYKESTNCFVSYVSNVALTLTFNNTVIMGNSPVRLAGTTPTVVANNCLWFQEPKGSTPQTVFAAVTGAVTTERATLTNCLTQINPSFVNLKNSSLGKVVIRVDDNNNIDNAVTAAATLNPEVKVTIAVYGHSVYSPYTAGDITNMRILIDAGNAIACHSSTHSNSSSLNIMNLSVAGATTATAVVSGVRAGDSDTWMGTLIVTVDGVADTTIDLATASKDTIGELVTYLNGRVVNGKTLTCSKYNTGAGSPQSNSIRSLCLADGTYDITLTAVMTMNDAAYVRFEWAEAVADLEAYIKTGSDRNGLNNVTTAAVGGTPSASYVCQSVVMPYDLTRATVLTDATNGLLLNANILGGNYASTSNGRYMIHFGSLTSSTLSLFGFPEDAGSDSSMFSMCQAASVNSSVYMWLWHGQPTYNGSTANLKTLLLSFGFGSQTMPEVLQEIINNTDFAIAKTASDYTYQFNWTKYDTYNNVGNFRLKPNSALAGAGVATTLTRDYENKIVPTDGRYSIGAYQYRSGGEWFGF